MRYFWTLFWTFVLMNMAAYVTTSMTGTTYDFVSTTVLSVIASVLLFIIAMVIPSDHGEEETTHS